MLMGIALIPACQSNKVAAPPPAITAGFGTTLEAVDTNDSLLAASAGRTIGLSAAKNEWTSLALRIGNLPPPGPRLELRVGFSGVIPAQNVSAYQVLPMPVDTNRAGYVRQTGLSSGERQLPRALLPMSIARGAVDLSGLRDPAHPLDPQGHAGGGEPVVVWIDLHVPPNAAAGDYAIRCDVVGVGGVAASVRGTLHVYDFAIPEERHLLMVGEIDWDRLEQLYPDEFEAITPRLMNRSDAKYTAAVGVLDQLVELAQANRAEVIVPRLQPTVKWAAANRPAVDWSDFDSVVSPWLNGDGFGDQTPLGFWPLPRADYLDNYDPASQREYWSNAATHFNREDWLSHSAAVVPKRSEGRATALESIQLSMLARAILESHPLLRVILPLEDEQVQFESSDNPMLLPASMAQRMVTLSPGLVFGAPTQNWPAEVRRPEHWMRTDGAGLVPYVGAGTDPRDVRLWAWLAYLRQADLIEWGGALPEQNDPADQADPGKPTWFYPGSWFGVEGPVASVQLKWLRRAQEDYEYLLLAEERGMRTNAFLLARLLSRQVELQAAQAPDPEYALLSGTVDQETWDEAQKLLARSILARPPGSAPDDPTVQATEQALDLDIIRWQSPKERPYVLPQTSQWMWDDPTRSNGDAWAFLRLGVDIYNAGDNRPQDNQLEWTSAGDGWEIKPQPQFIGALRTYWVQRMTMSARVNLNRITANSRKPLEITFIDGYTRGAYTAQAMLPVAVSVRREGELRIEGKLDDWPADDLIQDGQLTKMVDRPSIQHWRIEPASTASQIYTGWSDDNFYVAFRVNGAAPGRELHRNFVDYQFRRAWGEDLCQVLVQPIYDDNSLGPLTYLACKPNGVCMVKRRLDPRRTADPWRETDGTAVRYAANPEQSVWTGEMAIPWRLLLNNSTSRPRLLKFNFIQHRQSTGESASWAGPVDFDQDDGFMGLLYLQELSSPGLNP